MKSINISPTMLQSSFTNIEETSSKVGLGQVFAERGGYLNELTLFLAHFNSIPNLINERNIDCKKANEWFLEKYKSEVKKYYFIKRYFNNSKHAELDDIFYIPYDFWRPCFVRPAGANYICGHHFHGFPLVTRGYHRAHPSERGDAGLLTPVILVLLVSLCEFAGGHAAGDVFAENWDFGFGEQTDGLGRVRADDWLRRIPIHQGQIVVILVLGVGEQGFHDGCTLDHA